jgi:SAM-dependent methyltransferase
MDDVEFKLIEKVQDRHWWWIGRRRIIERLIRKYCGESGQLSIADVGSGFGANIPLLKQFGRVTALEHSVEAVAKLNQTWASDDAVHAVQWTSPDPVDDRFDVILLADVLEHIENDDEAAAWIADHLAPGGHAILTVPAHMHLWTEMDEVVHHYRRYSRRSLSRLFEHRLTIRRLSFYNLILYPIKVAFVGFTTLRRSFRPDSRKRSFNDLPPAPINEVFKWTLFWEAALIERFSLPFGISLVIVARRDK